MVNMFIMYLYYNITYATMNTSKRNREK